MATNRKYPRLPFKLGRKIIFWSKNDNWWKVEGADWRTSDTAKRLVVIELSDDQNETLWLFPLQ